MVDAFRCEHDSDLFPFRSVFGGCEEDSIVSVFPLPAEEHQEFTPVFENVRRIQVAASMGASVDSANEEITISSALVAPEKVRMTKITETCESSAFIEITSS